ncbi:hypothetical protein BC826DRAFT_1162873 [Russula brevipes]|nr:hypothetical protein BC826DRAFT_1162873 [Russula brevipes]
MPPRPYAAGLAVMLTPVLTTHRPPSSSSSLPGVTEERPSTFYVMAGAVGVGKRLCGCGQELRAGRDATFQPDSDLCSRMRAVISAAPASNSCWCCSRVVDLARGLPVRDRDLECGAIVDGYLGGNRNVAIMARRSEEAGRLAEFKV